ncbi:MAG: glycosyltransferase family 1 protein [bacterium]|nr:glycosyltransferase family 1 protein [bacterium]
MIIGVDIRPLMDKQYSGVSEYTLNLLNEILRQDKLNQYKLYYNSYHDLSKNIPDFNFSNVEMISTDYPNKLLNYVFFKYFNRPKIDRLVGADLFFMPHFNFIALNDNTKKIITIHDLSFLHFKHFFASRQNFWHRNINVGKMLKKFDKIIAVSQNTKQDIIDLCNIPEKRIEVIYSGISQEFTKISDQEKLDIIREKYKLPEKFILYLGNLEPRKNIEGIIEAYGQYRENNDTFAKYDLVIAGGQSWKYRSIYETTKNNAYWRDIHFLNYIDRKDKVGLYNLASLFLFPSFYEGFGFPPLEAAACGTPVIASNTSSLPEILQDAAILVNPYHIEEIANSIAEVLNNENLKSLLIQKGIERAKKFTWEKCARAVINTFGMV